MIITILFLVLSETICKLRKTYFLVTNASLILNLIKNIGLHILQDIVQIYTSNNKGTEYNSDFINRMKTIQSYTKWIEDNSDFFFK